MVTWATHRECELDTVDHRRIAFMLRATFPPYTSSFLGRRSWLGARPELRVVGYDGAGIAAHAGVLPVTEGLGRWPPGDLVWNGSMI